jgi:hypothetical protein
MSSLVMVQEYELPQIGNNNGIKTSISTSRIEDA